VQPDTAPPLGDWVVRDMQEVKSQEVSPFQGRRTSTRLVSRKRDTREMWQRWTVHRAPRQQHGQHPAGPREARYSGAVGGYSLPRTTAERSPFGGPGPARRSSGRPPPERSSCESCATTATSACQAFLPGRPAPPSASGPCGSPGTTVDAKTDPGQGWTAASGNRETVVVTQV